MNKTIINTKNLASYGAVLASVGLAPHAQASIIDLGGNLPGSLAYVSSTTNGNSFDLLGTGSNNFYQYNDSVGKSASAFNGLSQLAFVNASSTLTSAFTAPSILSINTSSAGTGFIGFKTTAGQLGWLQLDFGGSGGAITYLAAAFNDTAGESIHVGNIPEPSTTALLGLGLLAAGASGVRKLRKTAKSQQQDA